MEIFEVKESDIKAPLARRMSPRDLSEFVGQQHLLGPGKPLLKLIEEDRLFSAIFYGPPGCGKTALARIIAQKTKSPFIQLNAARAERGEIKKVIKQASEWRKAAGRRAVLFLDEVHRFNKLQQEFLLPYVEGGDFIFLGSTVENPFFALSKALLSRTLVFEFKPLTRDELKVLLGRALEDEERGLGWMDLQVDDEVIEAIAVISDGDARRALNYLEILALTKSKGDSIGIEDLQNLLSVRHLRYSRGDEHYDCISAFIKSLRGSDPDAAMYWYVRMLDAGEDPRYILRRLLIFAAEDIGLADPEALKVASAALSAYEMVGRPEGDLIIAEAVLYLATAPKSNTVLRALHKAREVLKMNEIYEVPDHLRDSHYSGAKLLGRGKGYIYPHGKKDVKQDYLPEGIRDVRIFDPRGIGYEKQILDRAKRKEGEVEKK